MYFKVLHKKRSFYKEQPFYYNFMFYSIYFLYKTDLTASISFSTFGKAASIKVGA